jgi:hypothetical protein
MQILLIIVNHKRKDAVFFARIMANLSYLCAVLSGTMPREKLVKPKIALNGHAQQMAEKFDGNGASGTPDDRLCQRRS